MLANVLVTQCSITAPTPLQPDTGEYDQFMERVLSAVKTLDRGNSDPRLRQLNKKVQYARACRRVRGGEGSAPADGGGGASIAAATTAAMLQGIGHVARCQSCKKVGEQGQKCRFCPSVYCI